MSIFKKIGTRKERFQYFSDRFLSKGTMALVIALFLAAFIAVFLIAFILFVFLSGDTELTTLVWISFMQTLDPGNLSFESGSYFYMIMMTFSTIVGIFITSILISIISTGFIKKLNAMNQGNSRVLEKGHTLILGWSSNVPVLIKELIEGTPKKEKQIIVILTRLKVEDLKSKINMVIDKYNKTQLIFRTGSIDKEEALKKCSISTAKSVVIADNSDFMTIKTMFAINMALEVDKKEVISPVISTIIYGEKNQSVINSIGKNLPLETVYLKTTMVKIIAQSAVVCGLSHIYNNLFDFKNVEIYFYKCDVNIKNKQFSEVAKKFKNAIIIGVLDNGVPILNPEASYIIRDSNELIVIAEDNKTIDDNKSKYEIDKDIINDTPRKTSKVKRKILIIGFNEKTNNVIDEIKTYCQKGSIFTILVKSEAIKKEIQNKFGEDSSIKVDVIIGATHDEKNLRKLYSKGLSSIIIFSSLYEDEDTDIDEDENSILSLVHLKEIQEENGEKIPIIIEIKHSKNISAINQIKVDDYVVSEDIASKMLAQISKDRRLNIVFHELLKSEGHEIYFKSISNYIDITHEANFYTLSESARRKNEIALGYKIASKQGEDSIELNPIDNYKTGKRQFTEEDYLIILSKD